MKKFYLLFVLLTASMCLNAQQIKDVQIAEVLASDDFEDKPTWVNFDNPDINLRLNNALGGTQEYYWSDAWGGACVHEGKSAVSGQNCVQLHWGGSLVLQGFEIDPEKIYQLEVMVHPLGGISGEWNNWGAVHLFVFDASNVWQAQGMRIRISNNESQGGSPALLAYDVWPGDDADENGEATNLLSFSDKWSEYTVKDVKDGIEGFWVPLKLIFTGEGTDASPFIIDFYLNDKFIETATITDLVWKGDSMVALQNGSDNSDLCRYDNFKLSQVTSGSSIETETASDISVYENAAGELIVTSSIYGEGVEYTLFNVAGTACAQGELVEEYTTIQAGSLVAGVYVLQVKEKQTGVISTIRTIIK